jgi:hypothetical protein
VDEEEERIIQVLGNAPCARPFGTLSKQRGERRNWTYEEQEQTKKEEEILSDQYREFINMGQ